MKRLIESLPSGVRVNGVAVVSAIALGWAAVVLVGELPSILGATFAPTASSVEQEPFKAALDDHQALVENSRKRFDGRSMFFAPPAPRPPRPKVPERTEPVTPPPPPPPPPPPATYTGPKPRGVLGDVVFFENDTRIRKGESSGGVTVLEIRSPYEVKLAHSRGEYVVSVWGERNDRVFKSNPFPKTNVPGITAADGKMDGVDSRGGTPVGNANAGGSVNAAGAGPAGVPAAAPGGPPPQPGASPDPAASPNQDPNGPAVAPGEEPPAPDPRATPATSPADRPNASPTVQPVTEPASPSEPGVEYVDRELLPPPLDRERVDAMSGEEAGRRLQQVESALSLPNVDDHSRARLAEEARWLRDRIGSAPR
jgi:hypothetical protein